MSIFNIKEQIGDLSDDLKSFLDNSQEYYKLKVFKASVKSAINISNALILVIVSLILLLFISVAVAIHISDVLDNPAVGFYIVSAFYLLLLLIFLTVGKKILTKIMITTFSKKLYGKEKEKPSSGVVQQTETETYAEKSHTS